MWYFQKNYKIVVSTESTGMIHPKWKCATFSNILITECSYCKTMNCYLKNWCRFLILKLVLTVSEPQRTKCTANLIEMLQVCGKKEKNMKSYQKNIFICIDIHIYRTHTHTKCTIFSEMTLRHQSASDISILNLSRNTGFSMQIWLIITALKVIFALTFLKHPFCAFSEQAYTSDASIDGNIHRNWLIVTWLTATTDNNLLCH